MSLKEEIAAALADWNPSKITVDRDGTEHGVPVHKIYVYLTKPAGSPRDLYGHFSFAKGNGLSGNDIAELIKSYFSIELRERGLYGH